MPNEPKPEGCPDDAAGACPNNGLAWLAAEAVCPKAANAGLLDAPPRLSDTPLWPKPVAGWLWPNPNADWLVAAAADCPNPKDAAGVDWEAGAADNPNDGADPPKRLGVDAEELGGSPKPAGKNSGTSDRHFASTRFVQYTQPQPQQITKSKRQLCQLSDMMHSHTAICTHLLGTIAAACGVAAQHLHIHTENISIALTLFVCAYCTAWAWGLALLYANHMRNDSNIHRVASKADADCLEHAS